MAVASMSIGGSMMITGINATVFVSDMNRAVEFYSETLGLKLTARYGDHWASIDVGNGAAIGLHPAESPKSPKPGTSGSIQIGLTVDRSLDQVVADLTGKGVSFRGPIIDDGQVRLAFFGDPDGIDLYLCEVKKWS
jgi:catechol 2,3-dioxygenase-like lactoylglutathione lyase family enzyme